MAKIKLLPVVLLLLTVIISVNAVPSFDFHMFENFGLNEVNFRRELDLVNHLKDYRKRLVELRSRTRQALAIARKPKLNKNSSDIGPIEGMKILKRRVWIRAAVQQMQQHHGDLILKVENITAEFPISYDFNGAQKGIIVLQGTFGLDPLKMANGRIKYRNKSFAVKSKMSVEDLVDLAKESFDIGWYDNCIEFLRGARDLAKERPDEDDHAEAIDQLAKAVVAANNEMVKRKTRLSQDKKVFPYMIDEKLLKKKKTQPKFVKNVNWYERKSDDPIEFASGSINMEVNRFN